MSGAVVAMGAGAGGAGAAAAAQRAQRHREEEELSSYRADDLEGWEFKIVRAATRRFKGRASMEEVLAEEASCGWEFLEKFDEQRIRLKRRVEWRDRDSLAEIDPYRTWVGTTPTKMAAWVLLGIFVPLIVIFIAMAVLLD